MEHDSQKPRTVSRFFEGDSLDLSSDHRTNLEGFKQSIDLKINGLVLDGFDMQTLVWLVKTLEDIADSDRRATLNYMRRGFDGLTDQPAKLELLRAVDRVIAKVIHFRRQVAERFSTGTSSIHS